MEVLESTRVEAVNRNDVVVPAARRNEILCVIWEGTCVEHSANTNTGSLSFIEENEEKARSGCGMLSNSQIRPRRAPSGAEKPREARGVAA